MLHYTRQYINVVAALTSLREHMEAILANHDLSAADVEPKVLQLCAEGHYDNDTMERLARMSATNKKLKEKGMPGLLLFSEENAAATPTIVDKKDSSSSSIVDIDKKYMGGFREENLAFIATKISERLNEHDIKVAANVGLAPEEYFVMKGTYGKLMDLDLNRDSYNALFQLCRRKEALKLKTKEECVRFLSQKIVNHARFTLKLKKMLMRERDNQDVFKDIEKKYKGKDIQNANNDLKSVLKNLHNHQSFVPSSSLQPSPSPLLSQTAAATKPPPARISKTLLDINNNTSGSTEPKNTLKTALLSFLQ